MTDISLTRISPPKAADPIDQSDAAVAVRIID
jgi:hypothetical protein